MSFYSIVHSWIAANPSVEHREILKNSIQIPGHRAAALGKDQFFVKVYLFLANNQVDKLVRLEFNSLPGTV